MRDPEKTKQSRLKMVEHLEAALAISDENNDGTVRFLIETALGQARADLWPTLEPFAVQRKK